MLDEPFAEFEIELSSLGPTRYEVTARYWPSKSDSLPSIARGEMRLDVQKLNCRQPEDCGRDLADSLFASQSIRDQFIAAQHETFASSRATGLRLRLSIDRAAASLHAVPWETLCGPISIDADDEPTPLSIEPLVPLSRVPSAWKPLPVLLRPRGQLSALVVIANPPVRTEDRAEFEPTLAPVDVEEVWRSARAAIQTPQPPTLLARGIAEAVGNPTPEHLLAEMGKGFDVVYIVCHGALTDDGPYLLLEDEHGERDDLLGSRVVDQLASQARGPRLIILTACQSAGRSTGNDAQMALGPELMRVGVPAVVAMNGRVPQSTVAALMPPFFEALLDHGYVDAAMAAARRKVRGLEIADWWMPVLFMRIKSARIWSVMHLTDRAQEPFEELSGAIEDGKCTPVIGPAMLEQVWGTSRAVARDWAEGRGFPLSPYRHDEFPSVAQYVARFRDGDVNRPFIERTWLSAIEALLKTMWPGISVADSPRRAERLGALLSEVAKELRKNTYDPYRLLARLPMEVYLTATPDPLLRDALCEADRHPFVDFARWTPDLMRMERTYDEQRRDHIVDQQHPLIFHLFGTIDEPASLVLTEDDFFDYLICVVSDTQNLAVPSKVRAAWSKDALILLGFDLDDWTFRVLHRVILAAAGNQGKMRELSAAAQLNPEEDRNLRPGAALRYLEQVFRSQRISISWSEPQEFLLQVWQAVPEHLRGRL